MINEKYTPTEIQSAALNVLHTYVGTSGMGYVTCQPTQAICDQAVRLVALGPATMEFILCTLSPDDSGYAQWADVSNYLPH